MGTAGDFDDCGPLSAPGRLAGDSHLQLAMKRILGIAAAVTLVLLQLAGFAALSAEPAMYLVPIDGPVSADARPA